MSDRSIVDGNVQQPAVKPAPDDSIQKAKSALNNLFARRNIQSKSSELETSHKEDIDKPLNKGESGGQINREANLDESGNFASNKQRPDESGVNNNDAISSTQSSAITENSFSPDSAEINNKHNTKEESQSMSALASPETESITERSKPCMQLKGSLVPMTSLELNYFDAEQFKEELRAKTLQAPEFFDNLPVVIGLEKFDENASLPFSKLIDLCKEFSIRVVAVRGGSELLQSSAKQAGLSVFPKQKDRVPVSSNPLTETPNATKETVREVEVIKEVEVVKTVVEKARQASKVVHHPVRSGQQVYAADGDLIVLASVSAGAEILADGNIHVYGTLRGRALAGVKGDTKARIFCYSMAAELVSIAGQYKISEDLDKQILGKPVQAYLEEDSLKFKVLES